MLCVCGEVLRSPDGPNDTEFDLLSYSDKEEAHTAAWAGTSPPLSLSSGEVWRCPECRRLYPWARDEEAALWAEVYHPDDLLWPSELGEGRHPPVTAASLRRAFPWETVKEGHFLLGESAPPRPYVPAELHRHAYFSLRLELPEPPYRCLVTALPDGGLVSVQDRFFSHHLFLGRAFLTEIRRREWPERQMVGLCHWALARYRAEQEWTLDALFDRMEAL